MKLSHVAIAALSLAAATAYAETPDAAGQFATTVASTPASRAQVQAQFAEYRSAGVNPWSTSYNPLKGFKSAKSRSEVQAEYIASRDAVAAMNAEDSGSAYLAQTRTANDVRHLAGRPVNAQ
jgi:hypothetical protein